MAKSSDKNPRYVHGVSGGYNPKSKRWHSVDGRITTRVKSLASNIKVDKNTFGGEVKMRFPTPISTNYEILEVNMSNIGDVAKSTDLKTPMRGFANIISAAMGLARDPEGKPRPNYMPVNIQSRMLLAEHFYNTDGDATNVCDAPIELLSRDIDVICPDKGLRKDTEDFIYEYTLSDTISELWSVEREFGQAFPFEVWDGKNYVNTVSLPPMHMHIGYNWGYSLSALMIGQENWSEALLEAVFPPAMFRVLRRHWDDSPIPTPGQGATIPADSMRPIWDKRRSWQRYSMPMLSRGFRELTDRIVYEDSIRALVEGIRYQFWVIKLGDADHPPLPEEITALRDVLGGTAGDRTGMIVWRDSPLVVEVHVPEGLDQMLGGDYHGQLTKGFFRKMGITSHVVSGEMPGMLGSSGGRGSGGGSSDIDVKLYVERARYQSKQVLDWATYLVRKWAKINNSPVKAINRLSLQFSPTKVEIASLIKDAFGPMYRDGALSHHTYVGGAGLDGDVEIDYKKQELKERDTLLPPVTYVQSVIGTGGEVKTTEQPVSKGSPNTPDEHRTEPLKVEKPPQKIKASDKNGIGYELISSTQLQDKEQEE